MIEVVTGVRRRCDWSDEEKLPFVPQTKETGASVSVVARLNYPEGYADLESCARLSKQ